MNSRIISSYCKRTLPSARGAIPRLFGVTVFDQGIVSVSNLLLTVIAARVAGIEGLGRLAVVATVIFVSLSMARTLIMEPMLLVPMDRGRRVAPHALIAACFGFSITSFGVVSVVTTDGMAAAYSAGLTILAITQDFTRYAGFREATSMPALRGDATVLMVTLMGGLLASVRAQGQANAILSVWVAALTCGVLVNISHLQWRRSRLHDITWRRDLSRYSRFLAPDIVAFLAGTHIILLILASTGGESEAATARAALTLLSPMVLLFSAVSVTLTPRWVGLIGDARPRLLREVWKVAFVIGILGVLLTSILVLTTSWLPQLIFGPEVQLHPLGLGVAGLAVIIFGVSSPFLILAKVDNALSPVVVIRSISAAAALLLMSTVTGLQVANGYFFLIAAQALFSLLALLQIARATSERRRTVEGSAGTLLQ